MVRIGAAAGRSDRFKVGVDYMDWKRGGTKGTLRMALVKWQGLDLLGDGEEWEPSWEPKNRLTADLKRLDPAPTRPQSGVPVARHTRSRKSPRVAGVDPEPGIPAADEKRRKTNKDVDAGSEEPERAERRTGSGASGSTDEMGNAESATLGRGAAAVAWATAVVGRCRRGLLPSWAAAGVLPS